MDSPFGFTGEVDFIFYLLTRLLLFGSWLPVEGEGLFRHERSQGGHLNDLLIELSNAVDLKLVVSWKGLVHSLI